MIEKALGIFGIYQCKDYSVLLPNNMLLSYLKHIILYTILHIVFNMERKLREINGSYILTIPKQVCDLYNFKPNDRFSIEPIGNSELRLRKIL